MSPDKVKRYRGDMLAHRIDLTMSKCMRGTAFRRTLIASTQLLMSIPLTSSLMFLFLLLMQTAAWGLDAQTPLRNLNHTSWTERDGVPPGGPTMAQTRDGWMWLGSKDGLFRFDGIKFERFPLRQNQIIELHAASNDDLLIAYYFGGMSVLRADGRLQDLGGPESEGRSSLTSLDMDDEGTIWALSIKGVHRYLRGRWETVDQGANWATVVATLIVDQYGQVWVSDSFNVYLVKRDTGKLQRVPRDDLRGALAQSPDGRIWVVSDKDARVVPTPPRARTLPRRPEFNQGESRRHAQFDRDGNLWIAQCPVALCRVLNAGNSPRSHIVFAEESVERVDQSGHRGALSVDQIMEDRESNLWTSTPAGIDRFRPNKLIPAHISSASSMSSFASDTEGQLWITSPGGGTLWKIRTDGTLLRDERRGVQVVANDRSGAILLAGPRDIERIDKGRSSRIAYPESANGAAPLTILGMLDDGKVLWLTAVQTGLMGLVDGVWRPRKAFNLPSAITLVAPGEAGQLWLGSNDGKLRLYDKGRLSTFDIAAVGAESGFFPDSEVIVAGENGIGVLREGRVRLLGRPGVEALRNIVGMTRTPDGDRWLQASKGIVHIRRDDWEAALRDPGHTPRFELIDAQQGYPGRAPFDRLPSVHNAGNGRIWFRTTGDVVRLETTQIQTNTVKPTIHLLALNTATQTYATRKPVQLPAESRSFDIHYTAPGLRKPEGMRFQYQLEGLDQDWQDAGTRRVAYYTNIGPGSYLFKARAVNEDGVAGEALATLPITIAPTLTETRWFRALCVLALALAMFLLYRQRMRAATKRIARQMQTRMDERERIARTLHDTFLQSVHVLSLQLYAELNRQPEGSVVRDQLHAMLARANRTIDEGRAQLQQLRTGTDLDQALAELGELLAHIHPGTRFSLQASGERRAIAPPVQEELGDIGQEAIRNAFRHANARQVSVELIYKPDAFLLRVSDDGSGFDTSLNQAPDPAGHWGLQGMRERALRVGARLSVRSTPDRGTVVELIAPASLVYASVATT